MIALIDADILVYRVGYTTDNDPASIAFLRIDDMMDSILMETNCSEFRLYLSDHTDRGFRYKLDNSYKATRTAPKPVHYNLLKHHLMTKWGAEIRIGFEADDCLGIAQHTADEYATIICSIDKDLKQIPGLHFNFVKREFSVVSPVQAEINFYRQILIGDTSDNIRGAKGIGPKKAEKAIPETLQEIREIEEETVKTFAKAEKETPLNEVEAKIIHAGRLLRIMRSENENLWHFREYKPSVEISSQSILSLLEENDLSTEHTTREKDGSPVIGLQQEELEKNVQPV